MDSEDITLIIRGEETEGPIEFIRAKQEEDLNEIFRIRARVYSRKGYFREEKELDIDEYDKDSQTVYFCAKYRGRVIGALRIIRKEVLPTEKYFKFVEPNEISKIASTERCEISRLVVEKQEEGIIPRNLVMLFLLYRVIKYAEKNELKGGYAFIKESLYIKLHKIRFPFSLIKEYLQRYPDDGILYNYFNDSQDKVYPIFFFTEESSAYIKQLLERKIFSHNKGEGTYYLENNLYTKFLKSLKII